MRILFQDDELVAVNKPSGLLVHRSPVDRHATEFALQRVREMTGRRVYPVHRLDRPTSGVLLFAFSPDACREIQRQLDAHTVEKHYIALVRGWTEPAGRIDWPLRDDARIRAGRIAVRDARTDYARLASVELPVAIETYPTSRYSLVHLMPRTGRTRQLRRHMAHIAHPIIGDANYGRGRHNRWFRDHLGCGRLLLHAFRLTLSHPRTAAPLSIFAPLDDPLASALFVRLGLATIIEGLAGLGSLARLGGR